MNSEKVSLSAGEWRVMEVLWTGPRTLMELVHELGAHVGWAKSTVTTVVRRMETKGLVVSTQEGRTKRFRPSVDRDEVAVAETESLLTRAYQGSVGLMVSTLARQGALTQKDIAELYAILDATEKEKK